MAAETGQQTMAAAAAQMKLPVGDGRKTSGKASRDYQGFVAGIFSGMAKLGEDGPWMDTTDLTVGHPFDTVKVRLQTTDVARFKGPLQCLTQTVSKEGVRGLYKGATPPLIGWMFMDSILMGSMNVYRRLLREHAYHDSSNPSAPLPLAGHGIAGMLGGFTVSFIAAPVEHLKARLQIQYAANKADRLYSGPWDCLRRIYAHHGIGGVYHGLGATLLFRSFFFVWWSSYEALSRAMRDRTAMSAPAINFWAGGLSAQLFWLCSYPGDLIKQRVMADPLGGALGDGQRRFPRWRDAATTVWRENGWRGYWRGFLPCFLRAFPANAMALLVWEGVMRSLP